MADDYQITFTDQPEWGIIGGGVHNYNIAQAGNDKGQMLRFSSFFSAYSAVSAVKLLFSFDFKKALEYS